MPRNLPTDLKLLCRSPLFSHCSRGELIRARLTGTIIDVPAGRVLCREGTRAQEMFVILDGVVELRADGQPIGLQRDGDWWGDDVLVGGRRHDVTAVTASRTTLLVFAPSEYRSLLESCPMVARRLTQRTWPFVETAGRRDHVWVGVSA
jgi:CRP-like cAMP-binding protein